MTHHPAPVPGRRSAAAHRPPRSHAVRGAAVSLAFEVFQARFEDVYIAYAAARLGDYARGEAAVRTAFAELMKAWPLVLSAVSPASVAWATLGSAIDGCAAGRAARGGPGETVILRHDLGLTAECAAETMGIEVGAFTARHRAELRAAHRP
ncbi:hypothetical protein ACIQUL_29910 [Streptomyces sp. NPDC090303]|uniref:hypothetical protein n=1 Tax=Streptomyces sp. NPDC090303 TaxID=3365960 RepID=UPI00382E1ABE